MSAIVLMDIMATKTKLEDAESEKVVIAKLLENNDMIDRALLSIDDKFFTSKLHKNLYKIVTKVYIKHGSTLTADLLSNYLQSFGIDQPKRLKYSREFGELKKALVNNAEFDFAMKSIKKAYVSRSVSDMLANATEKLYNKGGLNAFNFLDKKMYDLKLATVDSENMVIVDARDVDDFIEQLEDMRNNPEKYRGIPYGWSVLDKATGGYRKEEYILIIAKSGGGKTMGLVNCANYAQKQGYNVVYVTLEMTRLEIRLRQLSIESGIPHLNLVTQDLTVEQVNRQNFVLKNEIGGRKGAFYIIDVSQSTVGLIEAQLRQLQQNMQIDAVFIDQLQYLKPEVSMRNSQGWERLAAVSNDLRELTRTLKVPVIVAHQVTTDGGKKTGDDDLEIEDIALSRRIADPVHTIIGLMYDKTDPYRIKMCFPKCRGARIQSTYLDADLDTCRIADKLEIADALLVPPDESETEVL